MKPLSEKSWTPFAVTDKAHSSHSHPVTKSSSTTYVQTEKVRASDRSFARSSDGGSSFDHTPLRLVLPRLESNSRHLISDPTRQNQPGIVLSTPSEDENQTIVLHDSRTPPEALDTVGKSFVLPLDMAQREIAAAMRGSGSISPRSDSSLNEIMHSMPDTPIEDHSDLFRTTLPIRLKGPRIEVSESSIDGSLDAQYAVSEVSNTASANLDLEKVSRSLSKLAVLSNESSFDGPAPELDSIKRIDFEHPASACPPILEDAELFSDAPSTLSTQPTLIPTVVIEETPDHIEEVEVSTVPVVGDTPSTTSGHPVKNPAEEVALPFLPEAAIPVVEAVSTGVIDTLPTPEPHLTKKIFKGRRSRFLRRARRVVLRKPLLCLVLGRQLAAPTSELLKLASQGELVETPVIDVVGGVKEAPVGYPV